jgi:single-strand DNA-binding protein
MQKIILSGNLGKDAEVSKLESGRSCIRLNVAVNSFKGKGEQRTTFTQWYGVSYFVNNEAILQYLKKGATVVVCGNLELDIFKSESTGKMFVNANVLASDIQIVKFVGDEPVKPANAGSEALPVPDEMPY